MRKMFAVVALLLLGGCATIERVESLSQINLPSSIVVPGVGTMSEGLKVEKTGVARAPETMRVVRMLDGRPIWRATLWGQVVNLTEVADGTVVWSDGCPVPPEMLLPPEVPNQCGWGFCFLPSLGKIVERAMHFFTSQYACEPVEARMTAKPVGTQIREPFGEVTLVGMTFALNSMVKVEWTSYVKLGQGEVYAEAKSSKTEYSTFNFVGTPWNGQRMLAPEKHLALPENKKVAPVQCDVIAFGDSLTEGLGVPRARAYPSELETILKALGVDLRVCNEGISGSTSATAVARVQDIIIQKPKVVVVAFGANDARALVPVAEIKKNLISVVEALQDSGAVVVLAGLKAPQSLVEVPKTLRDIAALYDEVASNTGAIYVPWMLDGVYLRPGLMSADGLHPNRRGYRKMAETIAPAVIKAFGNSTFRK